MGAFRKGILLGLGIGYIQGAKAGRGRYEQIKTQFDKISGIDAVKQATDKATSLANTGMDQGKEALGKAVSSVTKGKISPKSGASNDSGKQSSAGTASSTASASSSGSAGRLPKPSSGGTGSTGSKGTSS